MTGEAMTRRLGSMPVLFAGTIVVGGLLALLLTVGASVLALQEVQTSQAAERMRVVAHRIGTTLEQRVDLGFALSMLEDTQRGIEREKVASAGIARIDVFGERGTRLFSTDRLAVGEPVPALWLDADGGVRTTPWRVRGADGVTVGVPVVNSFNRPVGGVAVVISAAGLDSGEGLSRLGSLFWPGAVLLLVCGVLALVAGQVLLGQTERALWRSTIRLNAIADHKTAAGRAGTGAVAMDGAAHRLTSVLETADTAEAAIHRLDETT